MVNNGKVAKFEWTAGLSVDKAVRKRRLETDALAVFARWDYEEIITPVVEPYDTLVNGAGESVKNRTFKFLGPDGRVLAMRPDITTPVAKLIAGGHVDMPCRVCYVGPVYRRSSSGVDEIHQAGAELFGDGGPEADGEIITVAADVLAAVGVTDWQIGVSHVGVLNGLIRRLGLNDKEADIIQDALAVGNRVKIEKMLAAVSPSPARDLLLGPVTYEQPIELLVKLGSDLDDKGRGAAEELVGVFRALSNKPRRSKVVFDPGVVRDFDYYSGFVFAIYVPGIGRSIGGGGRYDQLLEQFGMQAPASGFSVSLSDLMRIRQRGSGSVASIH